MKSSQSSLARLALGLVALTASCRWHEGGLSGGGGVSIDPATPPVPGMPATDAGAPPKALPPPPSSSTPPAPPADAGSADATVVTPPSPPATDASAPEPTPTPPPATDAGAADVTPPTPPSSTADPCATGTTLLSSSIRLRASRADDFTFDNEGRMLMFENRDIVRVGSSERDSLTLVRNVGGSQGGTLRVLPDGDILVSDLGRDQLLRIDPNGRFPERNQMTVRSPQRLVPAVGSRTAFYVTSQTGAIYLVDTTTGSLRGSTTLDFKAGGLAIDEARRKLYVGALGKAAVVAFTIGSLGELGTPTTVAEAIPQPTALAVDSCGGVFIGGGEGGAIRRIGLNGTTTVVARINEARDVTTLDFGSGKNGWSETTLYALDTYWGELHEIRTKR